MFCIETLGLGIHVCVMGNLRYCIVLLHLCYYKINQHRAYVNAPLCRPPKR